MKVPVFVGVPLIVITLADQIAVTPSGKPVAVPIPVAPVVAIVIVVKTVFTGSVGLDDGVPAELVMGHPQESPVEDIVSTLPVVPGDRLTHLVPFQYKISFALLPDGKSAFLK